MRYQIQTIFFFFGFHLAFSQSVCSSGNCVSLDNCPKLLDLAKNNPQFVRNKRCGTFNGVTLFCCSDDEPIDNRNGEISNDDNKMDNIHYPEDGKTKVVVDQRNNANDDSSKLLPEDCGHYTPTLARISGGRDVKFNEFPWMVLFQYRTPLGLIELVCGGSLINNRYVLTAAHCLNRTGPGATWTLELVRLGEYHKKTTRDCLLINGKLTCAEDPKYVGIEETIIHEKYDPFLREQYHDIGLVRLSRPVTFANNIKPICLPSPFINNDFVVAGWGQLGAGIIESDVLQKVEVSLVDMETCRRIHESTTVPTHIMQGQICAGGSDGRDSCNGDSGGPLMQLNSWLRDVPRWEVAGISSYGSALCGNDGMPGIYTDVGFYMDWILKKLRP